MLKNRIYILLVALMGILPIAAQHDTKAKEILDKVSATYHQSIGMRVDFKGTQVGTLWMKGEKFVLDCGGVKSWFDGETQWSYVADNEEVNISTPTPEEIQTVNPYALVSMYQKGFDYRFQGNKTRNGKQGTEILLIPELKQDIRMFILTIGSNNIPFYIGIDMTNGHYEEFNLIKFEEQNLTDDFFRFDAARYPNAEIIDLR